MILICSLFSAAKSLLQLAAPWEAGAKTSRSLDLVPFEGPNFFGSFWGLGHLDASTGSSVVILRGFEEQREKGAAPFFYVGIVHFYRSLSRDQIFFWQKQHNEHIKCEYASMLLETTNPNIMAKIMVNTFT